MTELNARLPRGSDALRGTARGYRGSNFRWWDLPVGTFDLGRSTVDRTGAALDGAAERALHRLAGMRKLPERASLPGRNRGAAVAVLSAALMTVAGCGALSEDKVKARFDAYVAGANSCERESDCTVVFGACPLGCFVAVRADRKADVEAKARDLLEEYRRGGKGCVYKCAQPGPVSCVERTCRVSIITGS
jgi:hypothetical protein